MRRRIIMITVHEFFNGFGDISCDSQECSLNDDECLQRPRIVLVLQKKSASKKFNRRMFCR